MDSLEILYAKIDALGDSATGEQASRLTDWIVTNIDRDDWRHASICAMHLPGVYTDISMRLGECGEY